MSAEAGKDPVDDDSTLTERLATALFDAHWWELADDGALSTGVLARALAARLTAGTLDEAWAAAEAALPEGWRPIHLAADDDDWTLWLAATATRAFFDGETDADDQQAMGEGPTPAAALHALATALRGVPA